MIELNGIQISDNNINTKKNVKIYVDEKQLDSKVGKLSDLKTTDKSSIVNAINEVKDTTNTLQVDVNRIYSDFTIIPNTPTEQEFTYKKSDEGVIEKGVAVIDKVKGNSVVWNQMVKNATFINTSEWDATYSIFSVSGGIASVTASADGDNYAQQLVPMVVGHKYLYIFMAATDTANKNLACAYIFYGKDRDFNVIKAKDDTNWHIYNTIVTCVSNTFNIVRLEVTKVGTSQFKNISLIDLTQMFGAGNEPSTYEEFLQRKPKVADEYAYNEGTIVNNNIEKVVTTGRNLCPYLEQGTLSVRDGSELPNTTRVRTPFIPISNKHSYCTMLNKWSIRNGCYYDRNKNFISLGYPSVSNGVLNSSSIPANAAFYRLIYSAQNGTDVVTPSYDVFMFAIGDTTIPITKYEPYEEHTLDLSWIKDIKDAEGVKLFEDGLKSAGTVYDEVKAKVATKRFGVVDLGSLSWKRDILSNGNWAFYNTNAIPSMKYDGSVNMVSVKYQTKKLEQAAAGTYEIDQIVFNKPNKQLFIVDKSIEQATDFKAAMQGVKLIYELAEPIVVEYDEKNLTYPVIAGGTEEAIASEPSTPMRASITYGSNTVATILSLMNRVNELERKIIN